MSLLIAVLVLAALAAISLAGARAIARANPPSGRFVPVAGGRLHVVELGRSHAPAVILLHGASGNLGDMRLALGERLAARYRVILVDRPGHGWSGRPGGRADASPGRQAALLHQALAQLGITRPIVLGHSWSGSLATCYALDYPAAVAGLVLLAPVTHPFPGGVGWINHLVATPLIGPLVAHTLIVPAGYFLMQAGLAKVFAPQPPPPDYVAQTGARMVLRPAEFIANAQDLVALKAFVTAQAPRYGDIKVQVTIIAGDADSVVSTDIHARAIAAQVAQAKLTVLPGVGHMVEFAAADRVAQAVDAIARAQP